MDMVEKRLGNFLATVLVALVAFGVSVWILRFIYNDAFLPILSVLQEINNGEAGGWSIANTLFLLLFFSLVIGFIYLASVVNKAKRTYKDLQRDRAATTKALEEATEQAKQLQKAQEEFEKMRNRYGN